MKKNMGSTDKVIRLLIVIIFFLLYFTGTVSGALGGVLVALGGVFVITSILGTCPLYIPFGISTCKKKQLVTQGGQIIFKFIKKGTQSINLDCVFVFMFFSELYGNEKCFKKKRLYRQVKPQIITIMFSIKPFYFLNLLRKAQQYIKKSMYLLQHQSSLRIQILELLLVQIQILLIKQRKQ